MEYKERLKKQILLNISDAYQATSVIRAIMFSSDPKHPIFLHLYSTEYSAIVLNIHKLFDKSKSSVNLTKLIYQHKGELNNSVYEDALRKIVNIQDKSEKVLKGIEDLRNNMVVHTNKEGLSKILQESHTPPELTEVQDLLKEIIDVIKDLSFINKDDLAFLSNRVGPKEVMDILHLEMHPKVEEQMVKDIPWLRM